MSGVDPSHENRPIFEFLVKNSSLTKKQVLALLAYRKGMHLNPSERGTRRLGEEVIKKGSYYRVLGQARKNVIKSFLTMILLHHLNIIDDASWNVMAELSEILKIYDEDEKMSEENANKVTNNVILAFRRMLSIKEQ